MLSTDAIISRVRRDLTVGAVMRGALMLSVPVLALVGPAAGWGGASVVGLGLVAMTWIAASYRSLQSSRLAADAPALIASGQFEVAEGKLDRALRAFSIIRTPKVMGLFHLAALRHAQRRWEDSAMLCRAVLSQRPGNAPRLGNAARLMLADAQLETGDLRGVHATLLRLYAGRLSLAESFAMLRAELRYGERTCNWSHMLSGVAAKIAMAELMPGPEAAAVQAMLARAADATGRAELGDWLRRRVELLGGEAGGAALPAGAPSVS